MLLWILDLYSIYFYLLNYVSSKEYTLTYPSRSKSNAWMTAQLRKKITSPSFISLSQVRVYSQFVWSWCLFLSFLFSSFFTELCFYRNLMSSWFTECCNFYVLVRGITKVTDHHPSNQPTNQPTRKIKRLLSITDSMSHAKTGLLKSCLLFLLN